MSQLKPLYTASNCTPAYQLNWSVSIFWRTPQDSAFWLDALRQSCEADGVRVLQHEFRDPATSQFFVSTRPGVSPSTLLHSLKGRLCYVVRDVQPKSLHRNYCLRSVGAANRQEVERYIANQLQHHPELRRSLAGKLPELQIFQREVDLSQPRRSAHGEFWYNLHVTLVHEERWHETHHEQLERVRCSLLRIADKKGHLLSRAGILADHLHLAVGCSLEESPGEVALCYMNNLAYLYGMKPIFQCSYHVGTFGEYGRRAIR